MEENRNQFLQALSKIELHVHLESTMPGELLERFAHRHGRQLPRSAAELYHASAEDLSDFLDEDELMAPIREDYERRHRE